MKTTKWKLHWLPNITELVPLRLVDFDHLITKKKLEEGDAIEDYVNKHSVSHFRPPLSSFRRYCQCRAPLLLSFPALLEVYNHPDCCVYIQFTRCGISDVA